MTKANYHTHTPRCYHARGTEKEIVEAAIKGGYSTLGFSEHTFWNYERIVSHMRMAFSEADEYVSSVRSVGKAYAEQLQVLCGLECEFFPNRFNWLLEQKERLGIDYIIFGNHFNTSEEDAGCMYFGACRTKEHLRNYLDVSLAGMSTGKFLYFAHPDLYMAQYPEFDKTARDVALQICKAAKELDLPLECNLNGLQETTETDRFKGKGYPYIEFWRVAAEVGNRCIIGVDAHDPQQLVRSVYFDRAKQTLEELGLTLVDILL